MVVSDLCADARFASVLEQHTRHDAHVDEVHETLVASGAPTSCMVITEGDLDGSELPLRMALADLMVTGGALLSCVPGQLAAYISEDGSDVFILRRPA